MNVVLLTTTFAGRTNMPFILTQKLIRDENGVIKSGSAAIADTVYVSTGKRSHSKHVTREKLGKVLYLSEDKKSGIFLSPTRGLVEYNAVSNEFHTVERGDKRIPQSNIFPESEIHTVFGDSYLLLIFFGKIRSSGCLAECFFRKNQL